MQARMNEPAPMGVCKKQTCPTALKLLNRLNPFMKTQSSLLLLTFCLVGIVRSHGTPNLPSQTVQSSIEAVTVFPDAARVVRNLQAEVPAGLSILQVDYLPNQLDASQLLVEVKDTSAEVWVRDVSLQSDLLKVDQHPEALALKQQVEQAALALQQAQQKWQFLQRRLDYAESLMESFADGYGSKDDPSALQQQIESTWTFYEQTHADVKQKQADLNAEIEELKRSHAELVQQHTEVLERLKSAALRVEVRVEAREAGELELALVYGVRQCSWQPVYEIRAHPEQEQVTIRYQAQIQQRSGEAWDGVQLTLSTASAARSSHIPELHPIYLNPIEANLTRKAEMRLMSMDAVGAAPMAAEMAAPQFEAGYSSFQVTLPQPFSMRSGKQHQQTLIAENTVDASFWSVVAPAQGTQVYLAAEVKPGFEMPLLAGESVLFVEQQMVGRSYLQATAMGESLELALGVNENLTVERKPGELMQEEKGIFGKRTRLNRQYFTTIRNASQREQRVRVKDQFPVSQNEKIEVKTHAPKASEVVMEAHNGRFYWDLVIPAGESRTLETRFEVSFPEDWNVPQHY